MSGVGPKGQHLKDSLGSSSPKRSAKAAFWVRENSSLFAEMRRIRESANARRFRRNVLSKMNPLRWASFWYTRNKVKDSHWLPL